MVNLLKSKLALALSICENEPIGIIWHVLTWGLIAWPIPEQVTVELCQSSNIRSVENRMKHLGECGHGPRLTIVKGAQQASATAHEACRSESAKGLVIAVQQRQSAALFPEGLAEAAP